jgi:hypothetical protein
MSVNFKQKRDLSFLVQDTFLFLKENFKPLGIFLLNYAGPFLLLAAGASAYLQRDLAEFIEANPTAKTDIFMQYKAISASPLYWFVLIFNIVASTVMMSVIYSYIKNYVIYGMESITPEKVLEEVKQTFFIILTANIVVGIATFAGMFLLLVGALYLFVALMFTAFIRVFENAELNDSLKRSLFLVKDNWWITFGSLLVFYGIIIILGYVVAIPEMIFGEVLQAKANSMSRLILSTFTSFGNSFLLAILYIAQIFIYFNLVEKKKMS